MLKYSNLMTGMKKNFAVTYFCRGLVFFGKIFVALDLKMERKKLSARIYTFYLRSFYPFYYNIKCSLYPMTEKPKSFIIEGSRLRLPLPLIHRRYLCHLPTLIAAFFFFFPFLIWYYFASGIRSLVGYAVHRV